MKEVSQNVILNTPGCQNQGSGDLSKSGVDRLIIGTCDCRVESSLFLHVTEWLQMTYLLFTITAAFVLYRIDKDTYVT